MKIDVLHILRIIRFGGKNIWLHKLRSSLTMLGIVFGVASVISMLAIGEGASFEAREKIKELGSNNIIIRSVEPPEESTSQRTIMRVYGLTDSDLRKIEVIPSVEKVIATWEKKEDIWYFEKKTPGRIVGTTPDYAEMTNLAVRPGGRFINEVDVAKGKSVAVIGSSIKNTLFPVNDPIGEEIKINSNYFQIIGVIEAKAFSKEIGDFVVEDINFDVYMPLSTTRNFFGEITLIRNNFWNRTWVKFHSFVVNVSDPNKIVPTSSLINQILESSHKKPDYEILVPLTLLKQAEHTTKIFNIVLGSIAAISLLVGGIGIMNIMLATVTERTREIGIRRALGAKQKDIIYQFVTEAVILSASGGFIGVALGVIIPRIVSKFAGMITIITLWAILLAFFISVAVGVTFGIFPARKAALLDPIEALRYE